MLNLPGEARFGRALGFVCPKNEAMFWRSLIWILVTGSVVWLFPSQQGAVIWAAAFDNSRHDYQLGHYNVRLLALPPVRKDMGIIPAVGKKLDVIAAAAHRKFAKAYKPTGGKKFTPQDVRAMGDVFGEQQRRELALLTTAQKVRLRELTLQGGGASELEMPEVAKALGLTRGQVAKLDKADQGEVGKMLNSLPKEPKDRSVRLAVGGRTRRARMRDYAKKVLTPAQWLAWKRMQGRPLPFLQ